MIVRERERSFICIEQHDHGLMCGWFAQLWGGPHVPPLRNPAFPLQLAASLHDVGWLPLDAAPQWDRQAQRPYDFTTLPDTVKLPAYHAGIERVAAEDAYAALLCSQHYVSFMLPGAPSSSPSALPRAGGDDATTFVSREIRRQGALLAQLQRAGRGWECWWSEHDLALLKFWDNLSLYVALNEPGTVKRDEHPWFRDGFGTLRLRDPERPERVTTLTVSARWRDRRTVALAPFPFRQPFRYPLTYREVEKALITDRGFTAAYRMTMPDVLVIAFVPDD